MKDIKTGEIISENSIDIRRPGTGIQPMYLKEVIGKRAKVDILKEEPLSFDMLE